MKSVIVIALVLVLGVLASAGVYMLRKDTHQAARDKRMAWALALRVALSISLFLFILLSWRLGWIQPTGLPVGR